MIINKIYKLLWGKKNFNNEWNNFKEFNATELHIQQIKNLNNQLKGVGK